MIEVKVNFHEVERDGLPKVSGDYLCFVMNCYYISLPFSSRHNAFNCYDTDECPEDKIENVTFWTNYPIEVAE